MNDDAAAKIERMRERRLRGLERGLLECDDSVDPRGWERTDAEDRFAFRSEALAAGEDGLRRELLKYAQEEDG